MTTVVKVSKAGIDVLGIVGTVPNNLIFDSQFNTFKILAEGTAALTLGMSPFGIQEGTVSHGQSGTPFVIGYMKYSDRIFQPGQKIYHGGTGDTYFSDIRVDGTNIYYQYGNNTGSVDVVFKYLIVEPPL